MVYILLFDIILLFFFGDSLRQIVLFLLPLLILVPLCLFRSDTVKDVSMAHVVGIIVIVPSRPIIDN